MLRLSLRLLLFSGLVLSVVPAKDQKAPKVPAKEQKSSPPNFVNGAQLWAANCSRCHNLRSPKDYRDALWKPVVYHMRVRGGFTGQETRDILEFLQKSN